MEESKATRPPLTVGTSMLYGVGSAAFGVHVAAFATFLMLFFNQVVGLPATWIGSAMFITVVIEALYGPFIGNWSDHIRSRWGRRHPLMYASALPAAIAFYFLWNPPQGTSQRSLFIYLVILLIAVRLLLTTYEVPSQALGPELTMDYDQRTSLMSWRFFFGVLGGSGMTLITYRFFLRKDALHPLGLMNRAGYGSYGLAAGVVIFLSIMISCLGTHRFIRSLVHKPRVRPSLTEQFREVITTLSNRSFLSLIVSGIFGGVSLGMATVLGLYMSNYFWELTPGQLQGFPLIEMTGVFVAVVLAPILSRLYGKKHSMIALFVISTFFGNGPVVLRLLGLFPENHSPYLLPILLFSYLVTYSLGIAGFILVTSMMADVVEDSAVVTGQRSEGLLFSANDLINKSVHGIGNLLAGLLLGAVSFPMGAVQGKVDPSILRHLAMASVPIGVTCSLISIAVLLFYNIDRSTHTQNVERLSGAAPAADLGAVAPASRAV